MKKTTLGLLLLAVLPGGLQAQRLQQPLGRAVVAVTNDGKDVLVTWRKLAQEDENCTYNLYMRAKGTTAYTKVNATPIDKTNFQTTLSQIPYDSELAVTTVSGGVESGKSHPFLFRKQAWGDVFFDFNFETKVLNPNNYKAKYAWPVDLDGNGEFDAVVVDRLYSGKKGDDPGTTTTSHKLQAYTLDGTCLWTIDMGPNVSIDAGQNDLVTVYDINGDGRAEVIIKSSDLTRFWDAQAGTWGKYANGKTDPDTDGDGITDYTQQTKRNPPFYISVVNARTGEEIDCSELKYDQIKDSEDTYSRDNRADYMNDGNGTEYAFLGGKFAIAYFDGTHPSLAVQCYNRNKKTGHHYYVLEWKYDWKNGKASNWHHDSTWSMNDAIHTDGEFHQMRVGDVNGDGIDEVMEGGYIMNPRDGLVTNPGIHHGDRFDLGDIDPDRPGLEVFAIQQANLLGQVLYDAATGEHIKDWYLSSVYDVARGHAMDVDPAHKGYEIFSFVDDNLYDCKGDMIKEGGRPYPFEASWWDGNLQREFISSPGGNNYKTNVMITTYGGKRLIEFSKASGWAVHAGGATRPAFMGDMTGDWREELILMKQDADSSTGLVGYSTNLPTGYSMYTLQQDPHYRLDCTTRGYYQMPNTSFYLGEDMPYPPLPPCMTADLRWRDGATWSTGGTGFTSYDQQTAETFADGKSVIFDMSGENAQPININGSVKPASVYVMNPKGHDFTFAGTGTLDGDMTLWKSRQGKATFSNSFNFSGATVVSEGTLEVNGTIAGPVDLRARGTLMGDLTVKGDITFEGGLNYEGCRLIPGNASDKYGVMTFAKNLVIPGNVYIEVNAGPAASGHLQVNGDLTFRGTNTITVDLVDGPVDEGRFVIAGCTGTLHAEGATFNVRGLEGRNFEWKIEGRQLVIYIHKSRAPQKDVVWTGGETNVWDFTTPDFTAGGAATPFVSGDEVIFDDRSANKAVTVHTTVKPAKITFANNEGTYSLTGEGAISGTASLVKNGRGEVDINLRHSDYSGPVIINEGVLGVHTLSFGGKASDLGAAPAAEGGLQLNGGTLKVDAFNMATDRLVTVSDTSTIYIANPKSAVSLNSIVKGDGYLVKDGPGQLNLNYAGENPFAGMIVKAGKVSTGAWNGTFGKKGSPMVLAGGTVDLIDVNNSSTRPVFDYVATVVEGTENTVMGTIRGAINGKFIGKGSLSIVSTGVRSDIGADFSEFEGTLTARGGNFRLTDDVTDMAKTRLVIDETGKVGHYASNSSRASEVTTKIGSLAASSAKASIGTGKDTYEIGYNNEDAEFCGQLKARCIKKVGTGTWTVNSEDNTADIEVVAGVLTGTLKTSGSLMLHKDAVLKLKVGLDAGGREVNDRLQADGGVTHAGDTLLIAVAPERLLKAGDELHFFYDDAVKQTGDYILRTEGNGQTVSWDTSRFASEGILTVSSVTGIQGTLTSDEAPVDVYTTGGIRVKHNVSRSRALKGLPAGVYLVGGEKVVK